MVQQTSVRSDTVPLHKAVLTIDDTTAHITAPAHQADELLAWIDVENLGCLRRRGQGVGGLDVIDFGDPSPDVEQRIRAVFAAWRARIL